MIPKIIHYCWFGNKNKPRLVKDCIKTWKKMLPKYEIIEWNEKNSDLSHPFVKEAYRNKKWAFVSDYIRFKVIYDNGGIYLDTDIIVLKDFDDLLNDDCFLGAQDSEFLNGAIFGALPKNNFIKNILDIYDNLKFNEKNLSNLILPRILTKVFHNYCSKNNNFNEMIKCKEVIIYTKEFFYPLPFEDRYQRFNYNKYIKTESYTIHLWEGSWLIPPNFNEFEEIRNKNYYEGLKKVSKVILKKGITFKYFKKILASFKQSFK